MGPARPGELSILLLSLPYPPNPVVGSRRFMNLAGEFERLGARVTVLTVPESQISRPDRSLPVPGEVARVAASPPWEIRGWRPAASLYSKLWCRLCSVDQYSGWMRPAFEAGLRLARGRRFTHIIATGPPFSPFVTALKLRNALGIPLVLDYRDPWTSHPLEGRVGRIREDGLRLLESGVISGADLVVAVTPRIASGIMKTFPQAEPGRVVTITNGIRLATTAAAPPPTGFRRIILHAGNLYGDRRLDYIALPLSRLMDEGRIERGSAVIRVLGRCPATHRRRLAESGVLDIVEMEDQVDYARARTAMSAADVLYLPTGRDFDYSIPFKFFDYLEAGRPVLAVGPGSSEMSDTMSRLDCGIYCDQENVPAIEAALVAMLSRDPAPVFGRSGLEGYDWGALASRYIEALAGLSGAG